jgi:hypothetical protein
VAVLQQKRHEDRPDVPGSAGDEHMHRGAIITKPCRLDSKAL